MRAPAHARRLILAFVLLAAGAAHAAEVVDLRPDAVGHAGVVTLGDLFDGVDGPAAARVVGRAPVGQQAVLDAGDVQLAARAAGLDWANTLGQRHIIVAIAAGPASPASHRLRHRARAEQALVYARNISVGEVVQASDLQWSDEAIAGPDAPGRPDSVIGMAARFPLREGAAVSSHDLVAARVIRRDQMISVDYAEDGVSVSLTGKAMADAAVGDALPVMNMTSHKIIQAVATAPGHAAVGEAADLPRAPSFQTAAN